MAKKPYSLYTLVVSHDGDPSKLRLQFTDLSECDSARYALRSKGLLVEGDHIGTAVYRKADDAVDAALRFFHKA